MIKWFQEQPFIRIIRILSIKEDQKAEVLAEEEQSFLNDNNLSFQNQFFPSEKGKLTELIDKLKKAKEIFQPNNVSIYSLH